MVIAVIITKKNTDSQKTTSQAKSMSPAKVETERGSQTRSLAAAAIPAGNIEITRSRTEANTSIISGNLPLPSELAGPENEQSTPEDKHGQRAAHTHDVLGHWSVPACGSVVMIAI